MIRKRITVKLYRKLRYRKGYGVHSPFVYNLITKIIEERAPYYVFEDIEKERVRLLARKDEVSRISRIETQSKNYGGLLFRLVNFFKPHTVLQIGSTTGIMSLYLASASGKYQCCFLEERKGLFQMGDFIREHSLNNIILREGAYETLLEELRTELPEVDLIHINLHGNAGKTEKALKAIASLIHPKTVLLIDGIGLNSAMRKLWLNLVQDASTTVSIDLYALGIVFFDKKYHKQHFKNYIDYGKKQNLHQTGRRRFNFLSRREKSSKNQSPH